MQKIPVTQFNIAFERLGWISAVSDSKKFTIWQNPHQKEAWTLVPRDEEVLEYIIYQKQNIDLIVDFLGMDKNKYNFQKIYMQLLKDHYSISSRVVPLDESENESIPAELASALILKNAYALENIGQIKSKKSINLDEIEMLHTEYGSFVIPLLIPLKDHDNLFNVNELDYSISLFLEKLNLLTDLNPGDEKKYADRLAEEQIGSEFLENILIKGKNSLAELTTKYKDRLKEITVTGESDPIIDYQREKRSDFKIVDLKGLKPISPDYLDALKKIEESDPVFIGQAQMVGFVEQIRFDGKNGSAMFAIQSINGEDAKSFKVKKGQSTKLIEKWVKICADALPGRIPVKIIGDVNKVPGKSGPAEVVVGDISVFDGQIGDTESLI